MKKIILALTAALCAAAFATEAKVVSVKGKVEVQDGNTWVTLAKNDTIEKGAVISTGYNSEAVIAFKGTEMTIKALTRATIEDLAEDADKDSASLFIDSGKVAADVKAEDGKRVGFKVRSPIATASVRGTAFSFTAAGELNVNRGLVALAPSGYEGEKGVPVAADQNSAVDSSGAASNPATEKATAAAGGPSATVSLTASEAVSTGAPSSPSASATALVAAPATSNFFVEEASISSSANVNVDFGSGDSGNSTGSVGINVQWQ